MKLLRFLKNNEPHIGLKRETSILDLTTFAQQYGLRLPSTIEELIPLISQVEELTLEFLKIPDDKHIIKEENLIFLPIMSAPEKIICVGVNYQAHADESEIQVLDYPVLFNKFNNALHGHNQAIVMPSNSEDNDYEAELALIIGKEAINITKEEALDYVFGYTIANDVSSRDWQFRTHQWMLGKAIDSYCPLGPYLVTTDEIKNPQELDIRTYVNGELRQNANTSQMIFDCAEIIAYLSAHMTLKPGDVILTGTPEGVILGMDPATRKYLQHGDEVAVEIEKIGILKNTFVRI